MPTLAQRLTRRVECQMGGRAWQLVFTHRALLSCECLSKRDMLSEDIGNPSASLLRALLFCALQEAGAMFSIAAVGARITPRTIGHIRAKILDAWRASMPDVDDADEPMQTKPDSGRTWMDTWGIAREHHGLTDEEWLSMTPRQIATLGRLRLAEMQRQELLVGLLGSSIINFSMRAPKREVKAEDFMLNKIHRKAKKFDSGDTPDGEHWVTGDEIMGQMAKFRPWNEMQKRLEAAQ